MQIVYVDGDERHELDVRVNNPSATVSDLAQALDPRGRDRTLEIGDRVVDPDFELGEAGLHEGAVVRLGYAQPGGWGPPVGPPTGTDRELVVVNGLDAGRRFPLVPGPLVIGRSSACDIALEDRTLSRRHATFETNPHGAVTVVDMGSHNGTWVAGEPAVQPLPVAEGVLVELGALHVEVRRIDESDRPIAVDPLRHTTAAGTIPFNRPPRAAPTPPPAEITPPKPPKTNTGKTPLSVISIIAPLIFAGVMFLVMRSPHFLLFAGLSPVMAIGSYIDGRRRGKKTERSERERYRREMIELRERLVAVEVEERARRVVAFPDPGEVVRRVTLPSTTLWERRPAHDDFLQLRAGIGDVPWAPPIANLAQVATQDPPEDLSRAIAEASVLHGSAVPLDLSGGGVVGIVGERSAALAVARSLVCQAATLHGPADMPTMVLASFEAAPAWDWAKWLPHTRDSSGSGRLLSYHLDQSTRLVEGRLAAAPPRERPSAYERKVVGPTLLVVVDDESLTEGRRAPTRNLLRGDGGLVAGIVVASTVDRLPAVCTSVIEVTDADGQANLVLPQRGVRIMDFLASGMSDEVARECARAMARFEDPELDIVGAGLPASIRLLPLLELEECTPEAILARWKSAGIDPRPQGPIGVSEKGTFSIDFVADGPHGLVGGTTGAGKSELLRTMVAGLAASVDPDHLTFVLIDFKGGSAFDECSKLPHTVGMVTDLDEHLAERALRCLEAELKHRERVLRDAAAIDLPDYLRSGRGTEPMPRLLVIIDEFATLKAELPQFIDALVGVAQRGRSLGVHMLLATQRPQGAISENIKANTNMRVALRVQDKNDSIDVIDVPDAAAIPRTAPGRAYVRLGPGEVVAIQSALSTGARNEAALAHVDVAPFVYGPAARYTPPPLDPPALPDGPADQVKEETDLSVLVQSIEGAFLQTGRPRPRRPWPDPLPGDLDLDALIDRARAAHGDAPGFVPLALADDPDAQTQYPVGWTPSEGNMIVYGLGGSGTTTALTSLALALARLRPADDLHIYGLDFGAGELAALNPLPHVGAVMIAGERERQTRLVRHLRAELDRRRDLGSVAARQEPTIVTMVDGWSPFAAEFNDLAGNAVFDAFVRVFADGPELGMYTVVAADRATAVPGPVASLVRQRFAMRLADKHDYTNFGVRAAAVPEMVPGRAIVAGTGQVIQIARPADGVAAAAARLAAAAPVPTRPPEQVRTLPTEVHHAQLGAAPQLGDRPWSIPIGISERSLSTVSLAVYEGEHVLITGPARSGKSSTLLTIAAGVRAARPDVTVLAVAGGRSPLGAGHPLIDEVVPPSAVGEGLAAKAERDEGLVLLLVDNAETLEDQGGVLGRLSTSERPNLLFVAAGRNDVIRSGYSHWTRPLRRSKLGVLLRPDVDLDGDILGTQIPRRSPVAMVVGRGFVVNSGESELCQIALPPA